MKLRLIDRELEINWKDSWNTVMHPTYRFAEFNIYMITFFNLNSNYET